MRAVKDPALSRAGVDKVFKEAVARGGRGKYSDGVGSMANRFIELVHVP